MSQNYINVSIPSKLIDLIDKTIKKSPKGYRSRSEFVITAIRKLVEEEQKDME